MANDLRMERGYWVDRSVVGGSVRIYYNDNMRANFVADAVHVHNTHTERSSCDCYTFVVSLTTATISQKVLTNVL